MNTHFNRRISPRRNTAIQAEIVFDGGRSARPCIVRNISEGGAKLELASVIGIPNSFVLVVPGHHPQPCRIAWRALKELGIAFQTA
jgi:hypothetical protein